MGLHDNGAAPAISGTLDLDGTEYGETGSYAPAGSVRSFRLSSSGQSGATSATGPDLDADKHERADDHAGHGRPDPRRDRDTTVAPGDTTAYRNQRTAVVLTPEDPPARARQGWTGADPTRIAQALRPIVQRPFDKGIADHPRALRTDQPSPLASRPRMGLGDVSGGQPFAGGQTGTQTAGVGPQPNSFRILPQAWDALLVNTGGAAVSESDPDPAYTAAAAQAGRRWRA
jgi:hypothetical protein